MSASRDEAGQDVSAALSDVKGRRDQAVAEFDEQLRLLEQISNDLQSGSISPKSAQDRVRRLINERSSGGSSRGVRAGRTTIGMRAPTEPSPATPAGTAPVRQMGPSTGAAVSAIQKAVAALDARMVELLTEKLQEQRRREARVEIALLRSVRSSLIRQLDALPTDVVLLGSVMEFTEGAQETLNDLAAGGAGRVRCLLDYSRELASKLVALGGGVAGVKEQLRKAQALLDGDDRALANALKQTLGTFDSLSAELKRRESIGTRSFLDELV